MQELLYTSVPRGLKPGSRGFCTVLSTQGMVAPLAAALEGLSGYRPVFPIGHERVAENPVVYSHLKLQVAGKSWYVLSRIADYGLDYSQRTNKLAHHLVLDKSELPAAGPASVLRASGIMRESWEGDPKIVPPKPISRQPTAPSGVCQAWKEMTGDAGWAGVLAESFLKDPNRPVILLFEPGQDLRPLIDESLSLLPAERRWDVTFSTYFTGSSQGITCLWRGIVVGSKEATESLRFVNALRIDLTASDIGRADGGELVEAARKGTRPSARPTPPKQTAPREQQHPRVVVMDDAEQPTVYRSHFEEAAPEPRAAPLGSHDHSQAPPRLTPSVFKFANARKQPDSDDSTARTSTGRKSVIIFGVILLLGSTITAGVFLVSKLAKDPHAKPTNALASNDAPQTPAASGVVENGGSASKGTAGGTTNRPKPITPSSSEDADANRNPEPAKQADKPASYTITLDPPNAKLTSDDADVEVIGEGQQRTVKVAKPDSKQAVTLIARLDGFQDAQRKLHPKSGQTDSFEMKLSPIKSAVEEKKPAEQTRPSNAPKLLALPKVDSTDEAILHEFASPLSAQELKLVWLVPQCDDFKSLKSMARDQSLAILHKEAGEDKKVATISVRDSKLFFVWATDANQPLRSRVVQKAQFCVLAIQDGGKPIDQFLFHVQAKIKLKAEFTSASIKLISDPKSDVAKLLSQAVEIKMPLAMKDVVVEFGDKQWEFQRVKDKALPTRVECPELATELGQKIVHIDLNTKDAVLRIEVEESGFDEEKKALVKKFKGTMDKECEKHGAKFDRQFTFPELKNKEGVEKQITDHFQAAWKSKNGGSDGWKNASKETLVALESHFSEASKLAEQIDKAPNHARDIRKKSHLISAAITYRVSGDRVEPLEVELLRFESDKSETSPSK